MADLSSFYAPGFRDVTVNPFVGVEAVATGINTGQGNQGTANQAQLVGHGGTPASQTGVPRNLKAGASSLLGTV